MTVSLIDTVQAGRMTRARSRLLTTAAFFGTLSLNLTIREDTSVPTLQTDGTYLDYNPAYVASLTDGQLMGSVAHETMHCANKHMYRMGDRDPGRANRAADYSINPLIIASGLELPDGALIDARFDNMYFEQIYAILSKEDAENERKGCGNAPSPNDMRPAPEPQPGDGTPGDTPGDQPTPLSETDWQIISEQAAGVARKAGTMPGDVDRLIKESRKSVLDWRTILRRFVEQTVPYDRSWSRPDRRFISGGLVLPGMTRENMPSLAVAVDTSASIDQSMLDMFAAELTAIMHETNPVSVTVIYCDSRVRNVEVFTPDDAEITMHPAGGGGTRFQPVFDWIAEQDEQPAALIFCTDLEGPPAIEPDYPVLWVTDQRTRLVGPFGETVRIPPAR